MKKIILISPLLQQYRVSFYEKLSRIDPNIQWFIYYGYQRIEYGKLDYKGHTDFESKGFELKKFQIGPFSIKYNMGMLKEVKSCNPDLVILQSITGNFSYRRIINWTKSNNKPVILWTCGWDPGLAKGLFLLLKNKLASKIFKKADFHLTYSTVASKYTEKMGVNKEIIRTCFNGIETDSMLNDEPVIIQKANEIRRKLELENFITFLFVGGLLPQKKLDLLIHAFSELNRTYSNTKLLIIGDGPLKNELIEKIDKLSNNNIYYLGRIIDDSDAYFVASDCLVMPGAGGLALNQAMFWRKICIVGEADGTEDDLIIEGKTGFRFMKDDLNDLIKAMERRILLSENESSLMAEAARSIVLKQSNVNNMVTVFYETVKGILRL